MTQQVTGLPLTGNSDLEPGLNEEVARALPIVGQYLNPLTLLARRTSPARLNPCAQPCIHSLLSAGSWFLVILHLYHLQSFRFIHFIPETLSHRIPSILRPQPFLHRQLPSDAPIVPRQFLHHAEV